jgi:phosphoglycerol transferase
MNEPTRALPHRHAPLLAGGLTVLICTGLLVALYGPLGDWLDVPLIYEGDGLWSLFVIKTVLQTGWYGGNPHMGAPFEAGFLDFAKPEVLHLAFYRLAGLFTQNVALVHNLFYALGFHLAALSALAVLRRGFGLAWPLAITGAVLFAFLPYHFFRLEHLFLSSYCAVPLAAWLVLKVADDRPPFWEQGRMGLSHWTVWAACAVVASTSIYYAFFGLVLVWAMGGLEALRRHSWKPWASASVVCAVIASGVLINLAPTLLYQHREGRNPAVAVRSMQEVEVYALRPLQMVLPSARHRSPTLAALTQKYESQARYVNENRTSALGLVASLGLVLLMLGLLSGQHWWRASPAMGTAARATAVALLLGVAGGLGSLIALVVDPQFRALNRVSVVIAFWGIGALLWWMQRAWQAGPARLWAGGITATAVLLLMVGLWDQVPAKVRPSATDLAARYASDRAFVQQMESQLPVGARVLQWPHIGFPEALPLHEEGPYAQLRGFLHGAQLRWSHGGTSGRVSDLWHQALSEKPLPEQLRLAAESGFSGIWLNRRALPDSGKQLEQGLRASGLALGLENGDRTLAFYPLSPTGQQAVVLPLPPLLGKGFYGWESDGRARWAWTRGDAQLVLHHMAAPPQGVRVTLGLRSLLPRRVDVVMDGQTVASAELPRGRIQKLVFELRLSKQPTTVVLRTDTPAQPASQGDPRPLAMALMSFEMTDLQPPAPP